MRRTPLRGLGKVLRVRADGLENRRLASGTLQLREHVLGQEVAERGDGRHSSVSLTIIGCTPTSTPPLYRNEAILLEAEDALPNALLNRRGRLALLLAVASYVARLAAHPARALRQLRPGVFAVTREVALLSAVRAPNIALCRAAAPSLELVVVALQGVLCEV